MAKASAAKKPRVYEVARDLGMSSEAVLQVVKRLGVEVKNHMSTIEPDIVAKVRAELKHGVVAVHLPKSAALKPRRIQVKAG